MFNLAPYPHSYRKKQYLVKRKMCVLHKKWSIVSVCNIKLLHTMLCKHAILALQNCKVLLPGILGPFYLVCVAVYIRITYTPHVAHAPPPSIMLSVWFYWLNYSYVYSDKLRYYLLCCKCHANVLFSLCFTSDISSLVCIIGKHYWPISTRCYVITLRA